MLRVTDVAKSYGDARILDKIHFTLARGERAGLIGPNGAGKSTLLRIIAGLEPPDRGSAWLEPTARLGYLAQALVYGPADTVGTVVDEALGPALAALDAVEQLGAALAGAGAAYEATMEAYATALDTADRLDAYTATARLAEVLAGLGLAHLEASTPVGTLSGGQKTRLGLARLLLTRPDLLLLDEPTNHLDIAALRWLQDFVAAYPGAVLIVSHDRAFLDALGTKVLALDPTTHTLEEHTGDYTHYADTMALRREKQLDAYRRQQERIEQIEGDIRGLKGRARAREMTTIDFALRKKAKKGARTAKVRERKLEKLLAGEEHIDKPAQTWSMKLDFGAAPRSGQQVLTLDGVAKAFDGRMLFSGVQADLRQGERVALLGPNGSGKTTLLRIISGHLAPDRGTVRLGTAVRPGYFAQEQEGLDPRQTALESLRAVAALAETEARNFLHFFLFSGDAVFTPVGQLSYGERARLVLARLVSSGANFLLLDEPLNHLDIESRQQFEDALAQFDGTVLAVAHDRYFVEAFAERIWALQDGGLVTFLDLESYEESLA
ncbi:MAG TPA: ABC-F family ATP-binding cassette domain-containing protein [Chloroflexia bacterium]|nr:ABC-F family ATP-binding cassette domain-containing protein [Chloroflexia bacterium]